MLLMGLSVASQDKKPDSFVEIISPVSGQEISEPITVEFKLQGHDLNNPLLTFSSPSGTLKGALPHCVTVNLQEDGFREMACNYEWSAEEQAQFLGDKSEKVEIIARVWSSKTILSDIVGIFVSGKHA